MGHYGPAETRNFAKFAVARLPMTNHMSAAVGKRLEALPARTRRTESAFRARTYREATATDEIEKSKIRAVIAPPVPPPVRA